MTNWTEMAEQQRRAGKSPDEAARALIAASAAPIEAIKAITATYSVRLGDAKQIVHRNLSTRQQLRAEALWDQAEAALLEES